MIERLSEDKELQDDFRLLGGVPLLLALLRYETYKLAVHWKTYLALPCVVETNTSSFLQ